MSHVPSHVPFDPPTGPPPGGPPPGPPGGPPAPPRPGMGTGLKVLIAVAAVAIVAIVAVVVLGGGDDVDPDSPEGAVHQMYEALENADCEAMLDVMAEEAWSEGGTVTREAAINECTADFADDDPESFATPDLDIELESETADTAVVNVTVSFMGESATAPVSLVREDGRWKILTVDGEGITGDSGDSGDTGTDDATPPEDPGS